MSFLQCHRMDHMDILEYAQEYICSCVIYIMIRQERKIWLEWRINRK